MPPRSSADIPTCRNPYHHGGSVDFDSSSDDDSSVTSTRQLKKVIAVHHHEYRGQRLDYDNSSDDDSSVSTTRELKKVVPVHHHENKAQRLNYHQLSIMNDECSTAAIRSFKMKKPRRSVSHHDDNRIHSFVHKRKPPPRSKSHQTPRTAILHSSASEGKRKPSSKHKRTVPKRSKSLMTPPTNSIIQKPRPQRSVHFSNFDSIYEIPHINDMSSEQKNNIWLTKKERKHIDRECRRIVEQLEAATTASINGEVDASNFPECFRGLESQTPSAIDRREELQDALYQDVMSMQKFQQRRGVAVPQALAEICLKHTASCQEEARVWALRDALDIQDS